MVSPDSGTRRRLAPGGSFIWPKTSAVFLMTPDSIHFIPKIITLTGTLADAREDGIAAVLYGDVADQLHE